MLEQLTCLLECSNRYACSEVSYLHRPFRCIACKTLLCIVVECDSLSIPVIICLVLSNVAMDDVVLSLGKCVWLNMFLTFFVIFGVVCWFLSLVGCKLEVLPWGCWGGLYLCWYYMDLMSLKFVQVSVWHVLLFCLLWHHGQCIIPNLTGMK